MIGEYREKVNGWAKEHKSDLFVASVIFLTGLGSFGLGRLSAVIPQKPPLRIIPAENPDHTTSKSAPAGLAASGVSMATGKYVGSISGSAYHLPWCSGALRIKESNKIWFQTKEEAEQKGYKPAGNCSGL